MGHPFFFTFLFCVCVFFFRVCCVRLARQGPRRRARSARTSSTLRECAPRRNSKQKCAKLCRILKKSTQIGDFSTQLSPSYTILKRLFAITMRPPPKQSVQIWPTFPCDFPKKTFRIFVSSMTSGTFVCDSRRLSPQISSLNSEHFVSQHLSHVFF